MPWCLMLLCCFLQTLRGEFTGISFIDSTPIKVCHRDRSHSQIDAISNAVDPSRRKDPLHYQKLSMTNS